MLSIILSALVKLQALRSVPPQFSGSQIFSAIRISVELSLPLDETLNRVAADICTTLNCDRVLIYQLDTQYVSKIVVESVKPGCKSVQLAHGSDLWLDCLGLIQSQEGTAAVIVDRDRAPLPPCLQNLLSQQEARAHLMVPVRGSQGELWGLIAAQLCDRARHWQIPEVDLLHQVALQIGMLVQNIELHQQLQSLKTKFAQLVQQQIDQAQHYQTLQTQVTELKRLNHLQDDFLSTVCHELRSPLSNIYLASQMLAILLKDDPRSKSSEAGVQRYLQILQLECRREMNLVNNLLDLSRLESGGSMLRLTIVDLAPWMVQFVEAFSSRMTQQQQYLVLDFGTTLPRLTTDLNCLEQAVGELIHNACKYTPAGEAIEIEMEPSPAELILRIKNSGSPIPAADLPHIFDKFYRIPNHDPWQQGGTGLGLALVKKRIEQLKGSIAASSDAIWTCFTIQLPWDLRQR